MGEIEGYFQGSGNYVIITKLWSGNETRYAVMVNYEEIASWVVSGKGRWITVETATVKIASPSIITIQARGKEAREAFIDFVTIKKK